MVIAHLPCISGSNLKPCGSTNPDDHCIPHRRHLLQCGPLSYKLVKMRNFDYNYSQRTAKDDPLFSPISRSRPNASNYMACESANAVWTASTLTTYKPLPSLPEKALLISSSWRAYNFVVMRHLTPETKASIYEQSLQNTGSKKKWGGRDKSISLGPSCRRWVRP